MGFWGARHSRLINALYVMRILTKGLLLYASNYSLVFMVLLGQQIMWFENYVGGWSMVVEFQVVKSSLAIPIFY
jgi:hypothetical protein